MSEARGETRWPNGAVEEVALAMEGFDSDADRAEALRAVADQLDVDEAEVLSWLKSELFRERLTPAREAVRKSHVWFQRRAAVGAEEALPAVLGLVRDPKASPAVKLQAAQTLARWGGLESRSGAGQEGPQVPVLRIEMPGGARMALEAAPPADNQSFGIPAPAPDPVLQAQMEQAVIEDARVPVPRRDDLQTP